MARRLTDTYWVSSKTTIIIYCGDTKKSIINGFGLFVIPEEIDNFANYLKERLENEYRNKFADQDILYIDVLITNIRPL